MQRGRQNTADDVADLVAFLPWWAGIGIGVAAYIVLHWYAEQPLPVLAPPAPPEDIAVARMLRGLAGGGQYAIPFICAAGALVSAVRRHKRRRFLVSAVQGNAVSLLGNMDRHEFEKRVAEGFRGRRFQVRDRGGPRTDGGVDMVLTRDTERFLVQCRHWKAPRVGVAAVRELHGAMVARGAAGGYVVTAGRFTPEAAACAAGCNIVLIDGLGLPGLIQPPGAGQRPA